MNLLTEEPLEGIRCKSGEKILTYIYITTSKIANIVPNPCRNETEELRTTKQKTFGRSVLHMERSA